MEEASCTALPFFFFFAGRRGGGGGARFCKYYFPYPMIRVFTASAWYIKGAVLQYKYAVLSVNKDRPWNTPSLGKGGCVSKRSMSKIQKVVQKKPVLHWELHNNLFTCKQGKSCIWYNHNIYFQLISIRINTIKKLMEFVLQLYWWKIYLIFYCLAIWYDG